MLLEIIYNIYLFHEYLIYYSQSSITGKLSIRSVILDYELKRPSVLAGMG